MYATILNVHSWLRWVVLIAGLWAILRAARPGPHPWTPSDDRSARLFLIALDVQMVLGLLLYFALSPLTRAAMSNMAASMKVSAVRFFLVEHAFGMVIGLALAHIGAVKLRRAPENKRHRIVMVYFGLALLAILLSIPWPGFPAGRPLFRI